LANDVLSTRQVAPLAGQPEAPANDHLHGDPLAGFPSGQNSRQLASFLSVQTDGQQILRNQLQKRPTVAPVNPWTSPAGDRPQVAIFLKTFLITLRKIH
jgi:hypothetical protein